VIWFQFLLVLVRIEIIRCSDDGAKNTQCLNQATVKFSRKNFIFQLNIFPYSVAVFHHSLECYIFHVIVLKSGQKQTNGTTLIRLECVRIRFMKLLCYTGPPDEEKPDMLHVRLTDYLYVKWIFM